MDHRPNTWAFPPCQKTSARQTKAHSVDWLTGEITAMSLQPGGLLAPGMVGFGISSLYWDEAAAVSGHGQGFSPDLWDLNLGRASRWDAVGELPVAEGSGVSSPCSCSYSQSMFGSSHHLSSRHSKAPRLFSVENARHLKLVLY